MQYHIIPGTASVSAATRYEQQLAQAKAALKVAKSPATIEKLWEEIEEAEADLLEIKYEILTSKKP